MRDLFSKRLQALRERQGMTQKALARAMGVSTASVCKWEQGSSRPRENNLASLAKALNVSPEYLIGDRRSRDNGMEPEQTLGDFMIEAKSRIAKLAGTEPEMVCISLVY
jgi:transcriptional regulator with XRE-family HTH domain